MPTTELDLFETCARVFLDESAVTTGEIPTDDEIYEWARHKPFREAVQRAFDAGRRDAKQNRDRL